jgi:membrane associated rhomboid family serine protease
VARLMRGPAGSAVFLLFYIAGGAAAAVGYGVVHLDDPTPLVGASGAVFGLIGAATRLMGGGGGVLPLLDRRVLSATAAWMAVNLITGLIGFAPGLDGARIAWEAHAFGFLFGVLAIGPVARLFRRPAFDSPPPLSDPPG